MKHSLINAILIFIILFGKKKLFTRGFAVDIYDRDTLNEVKPNYCNNITLQKEHGLTKTTIGNFLGLHCSGEFYQCRYYSDGYKTYKKTCKAGLVFDTHGSQTCNYDYNVLGCGIRGSNVKMCNIDEFTCSLSEQCIKIGKRCDGKYDCILEEDEQNCPMCGKDEFQCVVSEECLPQSVRCNGITECGDGTDELNCDQCGRGNFFCRNSNQCIPEELRCDGTRQCSFGEDEYNCRKSKKNQKSYACEDGSEKIEIKYVCDGVPDCPDSSDEKYCEETTQSNIYHHTTNPRHYVEDVGNHLFTRGPLLPIAKIPLPVTTNNFYPEPQPILIESTKKPQLKIKKTRKITTTTTTIPPFTDSETSIDNQDYEDEKNEWDKDTSEVMNNQPKFSSNIPEFLGTKGRKSFFNNVFSTINPNVIENVMKSEITTNTINNDNDDLLKKLSLKLNSLGNQNEVSNLLSKLESLLSSPTTPYPDSYVSIKLPPKQSKVERRKEFVRITSNPLRKWQPSLSQNQIKLTSKNIMRDKPLLGTITTTTTRIPITTTPYPILNRIDVQLRQSDEPMIINSNEEKESVEYVDATTQN
uniref:Chitin-binding type-2 domain-containing protein n=1 Tax=Strongyloides papillosus TaxID=174720 RepID=A0A0N5CHW4_STREA